MAQELFDRALHFEAQMELPTSAAELDRIRGNLIYNAGDHDHAASCIWQAMADAREKHAFQFELRAALDLLRLGLAAPQEAKVHDRIRTLTQDLELDNCMPEVLAARRLGA